MSLTEVQEPLLVDVRAVSKTYRGRRGVGRRSEDVSAVRGVSFAVRSGAALAIVGESGSGKTTIARMIVGSERPTTGSVVLEGRTTSEARMRRDPIRQSRVVQMVFQDPFTSLDPRQSIRAALDEVQRVHFRRTRGERETRTGALLESVGLGAREGRAFPRELSGGQCQRAAIARALAAEPRGLLLDEALSALDVSVQAQILNLLSDLQRDEHLTYILISHDLAVVRQICDEVVVMYRGEVMECGPVRRVLSSPAHPYTIALLQAIPRPGMRFEQRSILVADEIGGCPFRSRCRWADDQCLQSPQPVTVAPKHMAWCWKVDDVARAPDEAGPADDPPRAGAVDRGHGTAETTAGAAGLSHLRARPEG